MRIQPCSSLKDDMSLAPKTCMNPSLRMSYAHLPSRWLFGGNLVPIWLSHGRLALQCSIRQLHGRSNLSYSQRNPSGSYSGLVLLCILDCLQQYFLHDGQLRNWSLNTIIHDYTVIWWISPWRKGCNTAFELRRAQVREWDVFAKRDIKTEKDISTDQKRYSSAVYPI